MRRNARRQGKMNKALFSYGIAVFFVLFIIASPVHCSKCDGCDSGCGDGCMKCWTDCRMYSEKAGEDYQDLGWKSAYSFKDSCGDTWVVWNHFARHGSIINKIRICQEYCRCGNTKQYEATGEPTVTVRATTTKWGPREIIGTKTLKRGAHPQ